MEFCAFAEAQTSGRSGSVFLKDVSRGLKLGESSTALISALDALRKHTIASVPRVVNLTRQVRPVILLTDAAADETSVSLGGCIFDEATGRREFFGCRLQGPILDEWRAEGKEQLICQAELIAVPIAIWTWRRYLLQRNVLAFVDNEPAKDALIRGTSSSQASSIMVQQTRIMCASFGTGPWFARVPSPSNIADGPSRKENRELFKLGAKHIVPALPSCFPNASLVAF